MWCVGSNRVGFFRLLAALSWLALAPVTAEELGKADRVLILKQQHELRLLRGDVTLKTYPVALGRHPKGPKRELGDGRTPEGVYVIDRRTTRTPYHLALHISYPNETDRANARAANLSPGGSIWIHGMPNRYGHFDPVRFFWDWTDGCIAVGSVAIEEIAAAVDDGTPVEIRPR
jgi:murein L,D-transpeptidase YafK